VFKIGGRWHTGFELRLVPGAHKCDKELADLVLTILQEEFKLHGARLGENFIDNPERDIHYPLDKKSMVIGTFPVGEARTDVGEITLSEYRQTEAIYYLTHPYNHQTGMQVATTVMQMRLFADMLKAKNVDMKHLSLVTPVGPYDLNHSVRRHGRAGLVEGYSLKMFLDDLARGGFTELITLVSHSDTTKEEANALGMKFRDIDAFRGEVDVPSPALGPFLYTNPENTGRREDHEKQIARLTPFVQYIKANFGDRIDDVYFVATDDGSEATIEQMAYALRGNKLHILAIDKVRDGHGRTRIKGIKSTSTCKLSDIKGKICIMADDRRLSGGTTNDIGMDLHNKYKAGKVIAMLAHDMSFDTEITEHTSIDKFVFLETNPNSPVAALKDERIYRMPMETTAVLLAAEIFASYVNVRESGRVKVR
jgi:phosphoribosylpyrophosphate synthetase